MSYHNTHLSPADTMSFPLVNQKKHAFVETGDISSPQDANIHILMLRDLNNTPYFVCVHLGCQRPVGFCTKKEATSHVLSMHLRRKPFVCTTWYAHLSCSRLRVSSSASFIISNTYFSRKKEAVRHVDTGNGGKKYRCFVPGW